MVLHLLWLTFVHLIKSMDDRKTAKFSVSRPLPAGALATKDVHRGSYVQLSLAPFNNQSPPLHDDEVLTTEGKDHAI